MDQLFIKIPNIFFFLCGIFATLVALVAFGYAVINSFKKKKIIGLSILSLVAFILIWPLTNKLFQVAASVILITNAIFYLAYSLSFLFYKNKSQGMVTAPYQDRIAVLIPAKNEATVIEGTLRALAQQQYPVDLLDIFFIDDCSDDDTPNIIKRLKHSMPNLQTVVSEKPLGKAAAINNVLLTLDHDYVLVLDADHLTNADFIKKALVHFKNDQRVACVQGINAIRNGRNSLLSRMVQLEYLARYEVLYTGKRQGFFYGSGALFKTTCLQKVGGFNGTMLTEDLEVSYRLLEMGNKIIFDDQIATHELATVDFKNFFKQRHRWFRGIWQSFLHHLPIMSQKNNTPILSKVYYYHIIIENLTLVSFTFLNIMFSIDFIKTGSLHFPEPYYLTIFVIALASILSISKKKKWHLLPFVPLMAPYFILYAFPNLIALIDNGILKSGYTWVKTDRSNVAKETFSNNILELENAK